MKRIVVGVDGSDGGDRALAVAAQMAQAQGAELVVVSVATHFGLSREALDEFTRAESGSLATLLDSLAAQIAMRAADRAQGLGVARVVTETRLGDPAEALLEIAAERQADAVVVGKRGAGRLEGILLGSVSQKLASAAHRTVVIVP